MAASGALGGAFWCMLFGLISFVPLFGMAIGAAAGTRGGALTGIEIDDNFFKQVSREVAEGITALFRLSAGAVLDWLVEEFKNRGPRFKLLASHLSLEWEAKPREVFGAE